MYDGAIQLHLHDEYVGLEKHIYMSLFKDESGECFLYQLTVCELLSLHPQICSLDTDMFVETASGVVCHSPTS